MVEREPADAVPAKARGDEFGDLRQGTIQGVWFRVLRAILLVLTRVLLGLRIEGVDRVPQHGGLLVVSNHLHNADPLLIAIACPRPVHFMAKRELMTVPVIGRIIRLAGAFAVDRGRADRAAIRRAEATLEQGIALGMFPEGTRSRSRRIERVQPGAGLIALRGNPPIVPIAITGSERLPFDGTKGRRGHNPNSEHKGIRIVFGDPFQVPVTIDGNRTSPHQAIDLAMRHVADLLPEAYRGIYASSSPARAAPAASGDSSSSSSPESGMTNSPSSS